MEEDDISPLVSTEISTCAGSDLAIIDWNLPMWTDQIHAWLIWQEVYNDRDPYNITWR